MTDNPDDHIHIFRGDGLFAAYGGKSYLLVSVGSPPYPGITAHRPDADVILAWLKYAQDRILKELEAQ